MKTIYSTVIYLLEYVMQICGLKNCPTEWVGVFFFWSIKGKNLESSWSI